MEPWWNPGGTLAEPCLRAAPDHPEPIWAETPTLSAVGEKTKQKKQGGTNSQNRHSRSMAIAAWGLRGPEYLETSTFLLLRTSGPEKEGEGLPGGSALIVKQVARQTQRNEKTTTVAGDGGR